MSLTSVRLCCGVTDNIHQGKSNKWFYCNTFQWLIHVYTLTSCFLGPTCLVKGCTLFCLQNCTVSLWHTFTKVLETVHDILLHTGMRASLSCCCSGDWRSLEDGQPTAMAQTPLWGDVTSSCYEWPSGDGPRGSWRDGHGQQPYSGRLRGWNSTSPVVGPGMIRGTYTTMV